MKNTELSKKCEEYIENLISEVKSENSNVLEYLDFCARFHSYSFGNRILIWMQRPNATRIAGFRTWQKMGRWVKKREKGIAIFAPMKIKFRTEDDWESGLQIDEIKESDDITEKDHIKDELRFKVVYVWDVSQTEGDPLPESPDILAVQGEADELLPVLEDVVQSFGIELQYHEKLYAYGVSEVGRIRVLDSMEDIQKSRVILHELSHELLHGRWERFNLSKKVKELEAEATAYVVSRHFGLKTKAPTYLALYRVEEIDIIESLDRIVGTASRIIRKITSQFSDNVILEKAA